MKKFVRTCIVLLLVRAAVLVTECYPLDSARGDRDNNNGSSSSNASDDTTRTDDNASPDNSELQQQQQQQKRGDDELINNNESHGQHHRRHHQYEMTSVKAIDGLPYEFSNLTHPCRQGNATCSDPDDRELDDVRAKVLADGLNISDLDRAVRSLIEKIPSGTHESSVVGNDWCYSHALHDSIFHSSSLTSLHNTHGRAWVDTMDHSIIEALACFSVKINNLRLNAIVWALDAYEHNGHVMAYCSEMEEIQQLISQVACSVNQLNAAAGSRVCAARSDVIAKLRARPFKEYKDVADGLGHIQRVMHELRDDFLPFLETHMKSRVRLAPAL